MTRQNSTYPPPPPPPIKIGLTPPLTWVGTNDFYKMYCKRYSLRNLFPSVQSCPMRRHIGDVGFRGRPLERCGGVDFQLGIFLRNFKGIFLCFPLARSFFFCFLCANRNPPRPLRYWIPCKVCFCHAVPAKKTPEVPDPELYLKVNFHRHIFCFLNEIMWTTIMAIYC